MKGELTLVKSLIVVAIVGILFIAIVPWLVGRWGEGDSKYWIDTPDNLGEYTDSYKEKDGCVEFKSRRGVEKKWCGTYIIEKLK